jgi:hypothetical protein
MSHNFKIFVFNQSVVAVLILSYACLSFVAGHWLIKQEEMKNKPRPGINIKEL